VFDVFLIILYVNISACPLIWHACLVEVLFNALSASLIRRSRAWCSVEMESFMRETASLSGAILKLPTVWWMSCLLLVSECARRFWVGLTVAGSSSRSILTIFSGRLLF